MLIRQASVMDRRSLTTPRRAEHGMKGVIAFANPETARYAVRTEQGDFTIFDLLSRAQLDVGEGMTGDFHTAAVCC